MWPIRSAALSPRRRRTTRDRTIHARKALIRLLCADPRQPCQPRAATALQLDVDALAILGQLVGQDDAADQGERGADPTVDPPGFDAIVSVH